MQPNKKCDTISFWIFDSLRRVSDSLLAFMFVIEWMRLEMFVYNIWTHLFDAIVHIIRMYIFADIVKYSEKQQTLFCAMSQLILLYFRVFFIHEKTLLFANNGCCSNIRRGYWIFHGAHQKIWGEIFQHNSMIHNNFYFFSFDLLGIHFHLLDCSLYEVCEYTSNKN